MDSLEASQNRSLAKAGTRRKHRKRLRQALAAQARLSQTQTAKEVEYGTVCSTQRAVQHHFLLDGADELYRRSDTLHGY